MNLPIVEQEAVRQYPELHTLVVARRSGWIFRTLVESGQTVGIAGSLSRQQYTDAIFVFDRSNVSAARVLDDTYGGGCVWCRERADLEEVVTDLLGLPEPGESGAPNLVKRSSLLWTP
ncbi:hypothetical protein [Umezawaea sp. Da 62-37]|uniref:hypothetical protein n=1 Tax=Umezawaea sp. Da 62-37 TaxID=3075927 RepID=UPI0028F6CAA1|nr:hypothetical protein [Umezawaea sp. Da 62-37]WNV85038.1 hypothetical protein RM788_43980 [Umezawaea sp. Da 62-37]